MKYFFSAIKNFWKKNEEKIVLILGFILVCAISFEAGILKGKEIKENPLVIEKTIEKNANNENVEEKSENQNSSIESKKNENNSVIQSQECVFVGSKNSNKYHLPTCRWAKSIKPENLVCFSSVDDAKSKGYLPDKNCIK